MSILAKNDNISNNLESHKDRKCILKKQDIKKDYKDLINKRLDIKSYIRNNILGYTSQNKLLVNKLL